MYGAIALRLVNHEQCTALLARVNHRLGILQVGGHRLLAQHVYPRFEGLDCERRMEKIALAHADGLHPAGEELIEVIVELDPLGLILLDDIRDQAQVAIVDGDELTVGGLIPLVDVEHPGDLSCSRYTYL